MSDNTAQVTQALKLEAVKQKLQELKSQLEVDEPDISNYLFLIRDELKLHPELVYLLSAEEIAPIYHAIMAQSKVQVQIKSARKKGKASVLDDGRSVADLL